MTKILLGDEDFDHTAVAFLVEWGYDVITIQSLGLANDRFPDSGVLRKATELERTLLTHNRRDFIRLHRADNNHFGIIACTQAQAPGESERLAEKIAKLLENEELLRGKLFRIYRDS